MSGLYEGVRKDRKAKKDMWVFSLAGAVAFLLVVVVLSIVWVWGSQRRFMKFVGNLSK